MENLSECVVIVSSGKCAWGKCIFCPFGGKEKPKLSVEDLKSIVLKRIESKKKKKGGIEVLKFFNSGSFFDEKQIPVEFREELFKICKKYGIKKLIVESAPAFLTEKNLREFSHLCKKYNIQGSVAIGLEIWDDEILEKIKKPFRVKDYIEKCELCKKFGISVRTYLMVNLPFVKNIKESLMLSIKNVAKYSESIALINAYARPNTEFFEIWLKGQWKPLSKKEFYGIVEEVKKRFEGLEIDSYFDDYITLPIPGKEKREFLRGVGIDYLLHPYFNVWHDYIIKIYEKPKIKKYLLFLPCSYKKPYSKSATHKAIINSLLKLKEYPQLHQVMISNAGVIPREFENYYPFNAYDWEEWKETEKVKEYYYKITHERILNYLKAHKYEKYFVYLKPDSLSYKAVMDAGKKLNIEIVDCVNKDIYEEFKDLKNRALLNALVKKIKESLRDGNEKI